MPVNRLFYPAYQTKVALSAPPRLSSLPPLRVFETRPPRGLLGRHIAATTSVLAGNRLTHTRPDFERGGPFVDADGRRAEQQVVDSTPFASLIRFSNPDAPPRPKVLIVAPL